MSGDTDLGGSITQGGPPKQATYPSGLGSPGFASGAAGPIWGRQDWSDFMSAAEQLEDDRRHAAAARRRCSRKRPSSKPQLTQSPAKTGAKLRPLLALAPYVARYRGRAVLAFISLTVAAITTLVVPIAVRRMIDFGFSPEGIALINSYFSVMIAVVAVLAARQRLALLPRHDHRRAHRRRSQARRVRASDLAVAGLLRFRAQRRTGVAADRRHHPDQVRGRRLGLDRAAQHDAVHRRHRHDGDHEPASCRASCCWRSR